MNKVSLALVLSMMSFAGMSAATAADAQKKQDKPAVAQASGASSTAP